MMFFLCGLSSDHRLSGFFFGIQKGYTRLIWEHFIRYLGLLIGIILVVVATLVLAESDGESAPCRNCQYISCVPFPFGVKPENRWWNCESVGR